MEQIFPLPQEGPRPLSSPGWSWGPGAAVPGPQGDPRAELGALEGFGPGLTVLVQRGRGICVCWHVRAGVPLKGVPAPEAVTGGRWRGWA